MEHIRQIIVDHGVPTGVRFLFENHILTNFLYTEIGSDETLKHLLTDILDGAIDDLPLTFTGIGHECEIWADKTIITDEEMEPGDTMEIGTQTMLDLITEYLKEKIIFNNTHKCTLIPTKTVIATTDLMAVHGKISHQISFPMLRHSDGRWTAAFFIIFTDFLHTSKNTLLPRPDAWVETNILTGEIIENHDCDKEDFSTAPKDDVIDISNAPAFQPERQNRLLSYFDSIRMELILYGNLNERLYERYTDLLMEYMPAGIQRYYKELSFTGTT